MAVSSIWLLQGQSIKDNVAETLMKRGTPYIRFALHYACGFNTEMMCCVTVHAKADVHVIYREKIH